MPQPFNLADLLRDSAYKLSQFKPTHIQAFEAGITIKDTGKAEVPYVTCLVRGKPIKLTPEEAVRQLFVMVLKDDLGYPVKRMELEYGVTFGREKKRADICIFDAVRTTDPYILVELKKPKLKDGKEQLKSYCNATGAPMGVWSNGEQISYYHRKDPNYFEDIPAILILPRSSGHSANRVISKPEVNNENQKRRNGSTACLQKICHAV